MKAALTAALAVFLLHAQDQALRAPMLPGYLSGNSKVEAMSILPPPPVRDDARDIEDRAIFRSTRGFEGSARWTMAQHDDTVSVAALLGDFSCAAGVAMTPANAPKLAILMGRLLGDSGAAVGSVKDIYKRRRPFTVDKGNICVARTDALANSFDYPSGHVTLGWTIGLVMAEVAPLRANMILARARAFGESRVICGVHNASAMETGRILAAAVVAELHGQAAFHADLAEAQVEFSGLIEKPPAPGATCKSEATLVEQGPYSGPPQK